MTISLMNSNNCTKLIPNLHRLSILSGSQFKPGSLQVNTSLMSTAVKKP